MSELDELAGVRRRLGELLQLQEKSVLFFSRPTALDNDSAGPGAFFRTVEDKAASKAATGSRLTTTVTCLESLLEMPVWATTSDGAAATLMERLEAFMAKHLENENVGDVWKSDEAAWVYCRVRTLGSYARLSQRIKEVNYPFGQQLHDRAVEAWMSRYSGGASFGLREATTDVADPAFKSDPQLERSDQQYPPNAYLTYWGLMMRRNLITQTFSLAESPNEFMTAKDDKAAEEWLVENLAKQVAYHYNRSPLADPQQLLWSICGLVRFTDPAGIDNVQSSPHELLVAGLRAFFEQMHENGDWDRGAPLFHYKSAGNAYSYIYETLGELFSLACSGDQQVTARASGALRRELRAHWAKIQTMLDRAEELGQRVSDDVTVWASGHHPHRSAESWATASVFRFLRSTRRVIGRWCADETKVALGARRPRYTASDFITRGDTWNVGQGSVGLYLRLAFLWPIERRLQLVAETPAERLYPADPDEPLLDADEQARSAILFGPPGTGKTFMVEALASALKWDFIEITPAAFIDEGVDHVSARADLIFRRLMEVDRCVVLLDEIDELIQLRNAEADALERFFTTTMLPRLAALWARGRVIFFVNTNDIEHVDTAIRRSQRFDAALFVLPPSYQAKTRELEKRSVLVSFTEEDIQAALDRTRPDGAKRREVHPVEGVNIGWFALMRFDQIDAFAQNVKSRTAKAEPLNNGNVSDAAAAWALGRVATELQRLDWFVPDTNERRTSATMTGLENLPPGLGTLLASERRDDRRRLVWRRTKVASGTSEWVEIPLGVMDPVAWAREEMSLVPEPDTGLLMAIPGSHSALEMVALSEPIDS